MPGQEMFRLDFVIMYKAMCVSVFIIRDLSELVLSTALLWPCQPPPHSLPVFFFSLALHFIQWKCAAYSA